MPSRAQEGNGRAALLIQMYEETPLEVYLNTSYWGDICTLADGRLHYCRLVLLRKIYTGYAILVFVNISLLASFSI